MLWLISNLLIAYSSNPAGSRLYHTKHSIYTFPKIAFKAAQQHCSVQGLRNTMERVILLMV